MNAGSSSRKFQLFALMDGCLERRLRGQIDGIGVHSRLNANGADGVAVVDQTHTPKEVPDLPAALSVARDWLRTAGDYKVSRWGTGLSMAGRTTHLLSGSTQKF